MGGFIALSSAFYLFHSVGQVDCSSDQPASEQLAHDLCILARSSDLDRIQSFAKRHNLVKSDSDTHKSPIAELPAGPLGCTALHVAVANGNLKVAEWLLLQGCDVNAADGYSPRPDSLWRIESLNEYYTERDRLFPQFNARAQFQGCTPLHYAVMRQDMNMVKLLLAAGADADIANAAGHSPVSVPRSPSVPQRYKQFVQQVAELAKETKETRHKESEKARRAQRVKFPLEQKLSEIMVGQLMPIYSVSSAMRRRINGWYDANKPLVFMFLGSSGVGKSMLAKQLAEIENADTDHGFIRLDMSEYQSKHEMSRLIGSPPGYIGHEEGGQLTMALTKCPSAVVLLDEVEKAHPDVLTLMLQVFDEGRLTDGKGKTISCPNAVFIMTSNLVQDEIREAERTGEFMLRPADVKRARIRRQHIQSLHQPNQSLIDPKSNANTSNDKVIATVPITTETLIPVAHEIEAEHKATDAIITPSDEAKMVDSETLSIVAESTDRFLRSVVHPILKRHFRRDEFIGRINDFICFHPFSRDDLRHTVQTELNRWKQKAMERHSMELQFTDRVIDSLLDAYDEKYGYRSIIYAVEKRIVNVLAVAHEREMIGENDAITLDIDAPTPFANGDASSLPGMVGQGRVVIKQIDKGQARRSTQSKSSQYEEAKGRSKFFGIF